MLPGSGGQMQKTTISKMRVVLRGLRIPFQMTVAAGPVQGVWKALVNSRLRPLRGWLGQACSCN